MGRSHHKDNDNRDRKRVSKEMFSPKNIRHHDKEHLRELTIGDISEEEFLDIEEEEHGRKHT